MKRKLNLVNTFYVVATWTIYAGLASTALLTATLWAVEHMPRYEIRVEDVK
jgi:hypothetical protein